MSAGAAGGGPGGVRRQTLLMVALVVLLTLACVVAIVAMVVGKRMLLEEEAEPRDLVGLVSGDFNGDRRGDALALLGGSADVDLVLLPGRDGSFSAEQAWARGLDLDPDSVRVADIDEDRLSDVVGLDADGELMAVLSTGSGFGTPDVLGPLGGADADDAPTGLLLGDVDGDQHPDAVAPPAEEASEIFVRRGGGDFADPVSWPLDVPAGPVRRWLLGDVTGDDRADLVAWTDGSLLVRASTGEGFARPEPWGSAPTSGAAVLDLLIADFTGDGPEDLAWVTRHGVEVQQAGRQGFAPAEIWRRGDWSGASVFATKLRVDANNAVDLAVLTTTTDGAAATVLTSTGASFNERVAGTFEWSGSELPGWKHHSG